VDISRSITVRFFADPQSQSICGNSWSVALMKSKSSGPDELVDYFQVAVPSGSFVPLNFPSPPLQVNDYVRVRVNTDSKNDPACVGFSQGYILLSAKG
jgi:hypothetical protein